MDHHWSTRSGIAGVVLRECRGQTAETKLPGRSRLRPPPVRTGRARRCSKGAEGRGEGEGGTENTEPPIRKPLPETKLNYASTSPCTCDLVGAAIRKR
eukprot:2951009-Rhodomonas_salina.1